jgi:Flp pilus assembly protein TadG
MRARDQNLVASCLRRLRRAGGGVHRRPGFTRRAANVFLSGRRGTTTIEFAVLAIPFFMFALFIMEVSYDLYTQAALDTALETAMRAIQTGNAQNVTNSTAFLTNYVCPNLAGLLECNSKTFISVQKLTFTGNQDYYTYTTGALPVSGNALSLTSYGSSGFCNSAPNQYLLISLIYVGPTFIGGLLPGVLSETYNNALVHATLSTAGVATENYTTTAPPSGTTIAAAC